MLDGLKNTFKSFGGKVSDLSKKFEEKIPNTKKSIGAILKDFNIKFDDFSKIVGNKIISTKESVENILNNFDTKFGLTKKQVQNLVFTIMLGIGAAGVGTKANASLVTPYEKNQNNITKNIEEYKTHTIKKGDTLWDLSKKYNVSVSELKKINNLDSDLLKIKQVLKISKINKNQNVYDIIKGDTLWDLSKKYNVSVSELKKLNNLSSNTIYAGETLTLPEKIKIEESSEIKKSSDFTIITKQEKIDYENANNIFKRADSYLFENKDNLKINNTIGNGYSFDEKGNRSFYISTRDELYYLGKSKIIGNVRHLLVKKGKEKAYVNIALFDQETYYEVNKIDELTGIKEKKSKNNTKYVEKNSIILKVNDYFKMHSAKLNGENIDYTASAMDTIVFSGETKEINGTTYFHVTLLNDRNINGYVLGSAFSIPEGQAYTLNEVLNQDSKEEIYLANLEAEKDINELGFKKSEFEKTEDKIVNKRNYKKEPAIIANRKEIQKIKENEEIEVIAKNDENISKAKYDLSKTDEVLKNASKEINSKNDETVVKNEIKEETFTNKELQEKEALVFGNTNNSEDKKETESKIITEARVEELIPTNTDLEKNMQAVFGVPVKNTAKKEIVSKVKTQENIKAKKDENIKVKVDAKKILDSHNKTIKKSLNKEIKATISWAKSPKNPIKITDEKYLSLLEEKLEEKRDYILSLNTAKRTAFFLKEFGYTKDKISEYVENINTTKENSITYRNAEINLKEIEKIKNAGDEVNSLRLTTNERKKISTKYYQNASSEVIYSLVKSKYKGDIFKGLKEISRALGLKKNLYYLNTNLQKDLKLNLIFTAAERIILTDTDIIKPIYFSNGDIISFSNTFNNGKKQIGTTAKEYELLHFLELIQNKKIAELDLNNINKNAAQLQYLFNEYRKGFNQEKIESVGVKIVNGDTWCSWTGRVDKKKFGLNEDVIPKGSSAIQSMKMYLKDSRYKKENLISITKNITNSEELTKLLPIGTNVVDVFIQGYSSAEHRVTFFLGNNGNWYVLDSYANIPDRINKNEPIPFEYYVNFKKKEGKQILGIFAHKSIIDKKEVI